MKDSLQLTCDATHTATQIQLDNLNKHTLQIKQVHKYNTIHRVKDRLKLICHATHTVTHIQLDNINHQTLQIK